MHNSIKTMKIFLDTADTEAIKETMQGLATKSFALYDAEKGIISNSKED